MAIGALCQADRQFFGGNLAMGNGNSRETWWIRVAKGSRARAWTQGKEIRSMQIPSVSPLQHNYLAEWLNLAGVREEREKGRLRSDNAGNERRCKWESLLPVDRDEKQRGREGGSTVTIPVVESSQVYNVIDSRDRNERGEAKLCRGISTIIRIISPELGGRMARQIKLPSEFEFHRCIFARIASVAHVAPRTCHCFPAKKG